MSVELVYRDWLTQDYMDADLKKQLEEMTESQKEDAFYTDLEFGTAGMRGIIGPGTNRMNIYTIRKANVGFAKYILENVKNATERGVAIAYDNRHFSAVFAIESAKVLATHGIKAYVFEGVRPTPELSFAVRYLGCAGGIVITASHNPPAYNGYKIYDESGAQTLPTEADKVIQGVKAVKDVFAIAVKSEDELTAAGLIETIGSEIDDAYLSRVMGLEINPDINKQELQLVFSPLHGTAGELISKLLTDCGYTGVHIVDGQFSPNPNFPTVEYPNPEDPAAFAMARILGMQVNADILLATDPDADRLGVAIKDITGEYSISSVFRSDGEYVLLTGNQTGAIMIHYILSQRKAKGDLPAKGRVFDTIVSSELAAKIAQSYGMDTMSTLTGFKFIGEQARLLEDTEYEYVFGYEESYGSLVGDFVRDKDALQAVLILAEMAAFYKERGKTLCDVLHDLYEEFGYYLEDLANISLAGKVGAEKIQAILTDFRLAPPTEVAGLKVVKILDYQTSECMDVNDQTTSKIDLPAANVLKYILEDGSWFVLRPSGTEPKAKIYISIVGDNQEEAAQRMSQIKKAILTRVDALVK